MPKINIPAVSTKTKRPVQLKGLTVPDTAVAVQAIKLSPQAKKINVINLKKQKKSKYDRYTAVPSQEFAALMKVIEGKFDEFSRNYDEKLKSATKTLNKNTNAIRFNLADALTGKVKEFLSQFSTQKIKEQLANVAMWATSTEIDEFGLDPVFTAKAKPFFDLLYNKWWRVQTIGINNIPAAGRGLLVSNHSGGIPIDGAMIVTSILNEHPATGIMGE